MSRRARAAGFLALAVVCALASAALASRYRGQVEEGYGVQRDVVVVERSLESGSPLRAEDVERRLGRGQAPERFVPPDALTAPAEAIGAEPVSAVPAGSYLLASHLHEPEGGLRGLRGGRRALEVRVAAAGPLARGGAEVSRVDVVAAEEPGLGGRPRVAVLARGVPLLALRRAGANGGWIATLGLARRESLTVIEAENFSRELRLLPL